MYGYQDKRPRVDCRLCGTPTPMLGTKLCDGCWELERRVLSDPEMARKILANMATVDDEEHRPC